MLVGSYKIGGYTFGIKGYDFGDSINISLSSPIVKGKRLVDKGFVLEDGETIAPMWESLFMSIGSGNISVDQHLYKEGDSVVKADINKGFVGRLGSIIRGMKIGCSKDKLDLGGDLFQTGFNPMSQLTYRYNESNYITLEVNTIKELHYENSTSGEVLELSDDGSYSEQVWHLNGTKKLKVKLSLGEFSNNVLDSEESWDFDSDRPFSLSEIIERNPDKDYVWLKGRNYKIVRTQEELETICKKIWKHDGVVAFDTETTGLNVNVTSRVGIGDRLVGMIFSVDVGVAYYFPIKHKKIKNICTEDNEAFIIEKYFKPILEQKEILCHNGAYDWKVMYNYNICMNLKQDTYILFKLTLWNDHRSMELGLKPLTKQFLGRDSFELSDFVEGKFGDAVKFWDLGEEETKYYACPDTDNLLELYTWATKEDFLGKYDAHKIYEIEVLFSIVKAYQEYYGHHVDITRLDALVEAIKQDKTTSYKTMVEILGHDFNPRSSAKDLPQACFKELELPVVDYTDTGNPSTGKDVRKKWLNMDLSEKQKTFVKALGMYLDAATLESNFTKNIDKFATPDGLMFSEVKQFLETGRLSTANPNYQGYSDTVKKYIVPRDGYYAIDADYSTVEARIMVSMAGCKGMADKLKNPDTDYHRQKASDMFSVPYELVTDKLRKMSKGVNFGILYGLGDPNLGVNLYGKKTPENTRKARQQKKLYFKGMEELEGFIAYSKEQGIDNHFSTTFFRRRRYYDPRKTRKDTIERQSCNARIQGTAADLYKLAMIRLFIAIKNKGYLGKMLISAFVHDECFVEVSKSIDPMKALKMIKDAMMINIDGWCPLFIGAGFGRSWYEAKHTEIPVQVQDYFVGTFGESGLDWWNGDSDRLCEFVVNTIMNYKRDRVLNYLKNEDNWGKVFQPTENELAHSLMYDILDGQKVEGCIDSNPKMSDDMIENLKEFCRIFDCLDLFEKANVQKPVHTETQSPQQVDSDDTEPLDSESDPKEVMMARLNMMGVYTSRTAEGNFLYFKYTDRDKVFMNNLYALFSKNRGDVEVIAVKDDGSMYTTGLKTSNVAYSRALQLFLSRKNILGSF